jgi:hypothetical protein
VRRLFWIGVGVGSTLYTQRRVKEAVGEVTAANVGREVVRVARRVGDDVVRSVGSAVIEGRDTARREERILRSELGLRPDPLRTVDIE